MAGTYTLPGVLLSGVHSSRPAASAVASGTLYAETDTGQTYQSDGVSTWTAWGAVAGGGGGGVGALVLLEQHTASSSATLDFTTAISSTYDDYLIEVLNVLPVTNTVDLVMEVSTDGGSTWDTTSGHYSWEAMRSNTSGSSSSGSTSASGITVSANTTDHVQNDANNGGVHGSFRLIAPGSAIYKYLFGNVSLYYGSAWVTAFIGGRYLQTAAVNALRFLFSSGDIASGTIRVYGVAKV